MRIPNHFSFIFHTELESDMEMENYLKKADTLRGIWENATSAEKDGMDKLCMVLTGWKLSSLCEKDCTWADLDEWGCPVGDKRFDQYRTDEQKGVHKN